MNRIIITGATSMLGVALTEVAVRERTEVYAIIRENTKRRSRIIESPYVHVVYGSLEKLCEIEEIPQGCDALYHFAWNGTGKENRDNPDIQAKNIQYSIDAVRLAKKLGCRRFIGAGSQAEYGPAEGIIDDNTAFNPLVSYGIAKHAAALLSRKLCEQIGVEYVWGRVFSVYGPHDNEGTMIDYAIKCWTCGEIAKFSSATQKWNYLYESDAGEIFYRLGEKDVPEGTWLVANNESKSLRDYIEIMMNTYGYGAKAEFGKQPLRAQEGLDVDVKNTLRTVQYVPKISFEDGINKTIKAFQENNFRRN